MKKVILAVIMLLSVCSISAQSTVVKKGNVYSYTSHRAAKDTLVTSFQFEDSKGKKYPIIVGRSNGRCWIWKKSSKTGKMYKQYMKEELAKSVCKELGITYVPKKEKK